MVNPVAPTTASPAKTEVSASPSPAVVAPSQQAPETSSIPKADEILKRVSARKEESPSIVDANSEVFSSSDLKAHLETITDPNERSKFEAVYKNMEKGLQRKFQKIADLEKKLKESDTWTPERLQKELNRPDFLEAATRVTQSQQPQTPAPQGYQGNDWSALSPSEQAEIRGQRAELEKLRQEHAMLAGSLAVQKADEEIKSKIPTYDPDEVNRLQDDLRQGRWDARQIREALWKANNFDKIMEQTYDLALKDKAGNIQEKKSATTMQGSNQTTQKEAPNQQPNESRAQLFRRLALKAKDDLMAGIRR